MGSEEYNLGLSLKRTDIVADYLVSNHNISSDRIVRLWFGQLNPVADNSTEEGRRLNRRVELAVGGL
jgi:OOP family OmpA-OmpF porin